MEKRAFTVLEASEYLGGISRQTLYRLVGKGEINSFYIGTRRFFPRESLDEFIDARICLASEN